MHLSGRDEGLVPVKPPKVSEHMFLAVNWGGTMLALMFLTGRIYTRLRGYRSLFFDDFFVVTAWLMLLANSVVWQIVADDMYEEMYVSSGLKPFDDSFFEHPLSYLKPSLAILILLSLGIWSVKLSFLVFFKRLGVQVKGQTIHWWIVFGFTLATLVAQLGTIPYKCLVGSISFELTQCRSGPEVKFEEDGLFILVALDVASDIAIVSIPLSLLWHVRIDARQKSALLSIFSLTMFVIVVAVLRTALVRERSDLADQSWMYTWLSIEQIVSIIIACIVSFRSLFTKRKTPRKPGIVAGRLTTRPPSWSRRSSYQHSRSMQTSISKGPRQNSAALPANLLQGLKPVYTVVTSAESRHKMYEPVPLHGIRAAHRSGLAR